MLLAGKWLAGCVAGVCKESEDPSARGALKVAAPSSIYQLGLLLQIESVRVLVAYLTLPLPYLYSLTCHPLHFLPHIVSGKDPSAILPFDPVVCFLIPKFLWFPLKRREFTRDASRLGSCVTSDSWVCVCVCVSAPLSVSCHGILDGASSHHHSLSSRTLSPGPSAG